MVRLGDARTPMREWAERVVGGGNRHGARSLAPIRASSAISGANGQCARMRVLQGKPRV